MSLPRRGKPVHYYLFESTKEASMSAAILTDCQEIARQTEVETGLLKNLCDGLRNVLAWEVHDGDCSRKLSSLLFIAQSFKRHLGRLMTLEELNGYMDLVLESKPFLGLKVHALQQEHDRFRYRIRRIVQELKHVSSWDAYALDQIGDDLLSLLDRLERHTKKEARLIQDALGQEEGGEG
jgi:Hemerythrin HHE cation binding domain